MKTLFTCFATALLHEYLLKGYSEPLERVWSARTYHAHTCTNRTLREVLHRIDDDLLAVQSTGYRWGQTQPVAEQRFFTRHIGKYWTLNWPRNSNGAIWNVYLPPCGTTGSEQIVQSTWLWTEDVLHSLPLRTLAILLLDANARWSSRITIFVNGMPLIGSFGGERAHTNGQLLREFVNRTGLAVLNTFLSSGSGSIWFNTQGRQSRIDFVITCNEAAARTQSLIVDSRLGFLLQLPDTANSADHSPVRWRFHFGLQLPHTSADSSCSKPVIQQLVYNEDFRQCLETQASDWIAAEDTPSVLCPAEEQQNPDLFWQFLNDGFKTIVLRNLRRFSNGFQASRSDEVSDLLAERWQLPSSMY